MSVPAATSQRDLAQNLSKVLSQVTEGMDPQALVGEEGHKQACDQWIATARAAVQAAQKRTLELIQIEQLEMALYYRTHLTSSDSPVSTVQPLLELLRDQYKAFFPNGLPEEFVINQLQYLCRKYPEFVKRLQTPATSHDEWSTNFIKFALIAPSQSRYRDVKTTQWVDIFIKYPEIAQRLMKSHLYEKLGIYAENIALIEKIPTGEVKGVWHVCLKMDLVDKETNWVSVHDHRPFRLKNIAQPDQELSLTMEQVLKEFEKPCPDFDVSKDGIINLNPLLLGSKKNNEGVLELIEPSQWRKYKPCMKLTVPQLHGKYGSLQAHFEYGFVLRADRSLSNNAAAPTHAYFDFIIKEKGNYRVFSMNPDQGQERLLCEQKMVFYALSEKQANAVCRKIAADIMHCRASHAQGQSTPVTNFETYMDEIFGGDFYEFLTGLASKLQEGPQLKAQLDLAKQTFDPQDFEKFVGPILQKLVHKDRDVPQMRTLMETSLNTLKFLLQIKEVTSISVPDLEAIRPVFTALYNANEEVKIYESLFALTRLCFILLHPFSVKATEVEKNTPVVGKFVRFVEAIPFPFLRQLCEALLLLVLSRFRKYRYKKPGEACSQGIVATLLGKISDLKPLPYFNLPDQIFKSYGLDALGEHTTTIKGHVTILTGR
ncbi:MAG: hypothetical protein JSS10_08585 [Verrucomicrobia bacterium]|nr:hypothetical protein [Verrucomicrobiota bacterium]